jgi:two-component system LytT family response regulator
VVLRAIIVEDEAPARARLRALLGADSGVAVVGEAENVRVARELLEELRPDLLFVDIRMPEESGLGFLRGLDPSERPAVIFTTAHPEYAVDAFEINAADYLVKPLDAERVLRAINRARRLIAGGVASARLVNPTRRRERFAVQLRGETIFIKAMEIDWIAAERNYTRLHCGATSYLLRESMQRMEECLDPANFLRVHRSAIVNLDRIVKLVPGSETTATIVLSTGAAIPLSSTYRRRLEELLGQKL